MNVEYRVEPELSASEFVDLLQRSSLAERRPVDEPHTMEAMLRGATQILTARSGSKLVGVSRAISDGAYCTYLSDLAVDVDFQRQGIGRELVARTHQAAGVSTTLILLSAPKATSYYPHIGMQPHDSCWVTPRQPAPINAQEESAAAYSDAQNNEEARIEFEETELDGFFDNMAAEYDAAIRRCVPRYDEMLSMLLSYLPPELGDSPRVLELGAGTGNLTQLVSEKYPGSSLTAVDISADSLAICKSRLGTQRNFRPVVADMRKVDFEEGEFDLIVSSIAIHHLTSLEKQELFSRCFDWLNPKMGVFSYCDQFSSPQRRIYEDNIARWKVLAIQKGATEEEWQVWMDHQAEHDHHDTLDKQLTWLERAGFRQTDCIWRNLLWTVLTALR